MARYIDFTEEQIYRAAHTDIKSFLEAKGEKVLRSGSEWMWEANRSVKIRGHIFYDHSSTQEKGTAIDFLGAFYNMRFQDAVLTLLGDDYRGFPLLRSEKIEKEIIPFVLPKRNRNMTRVYAYLMQERQIDESIISFFAHLRTLYESDRTHNCVFVGLDVNGKARAAHQRGTLTDRPFRGDVDGSEKEYFFNYFGGSDRLYVFEAPIDLMSFLTLNKHSYWQQHNFLALGGLSDRALIRFLSEHKNIKQIVFCFDNDYNARKKDGTPDVNHGQITAERYRIEYARKDYKTSVLTPEMKDWNDILTMKKRRPLICMFTKILHKQLSLLMAKA